MNNIPEIKLGIVAVSRDCFPIALSESRRKAIVNAYGEGIYECPVTVENELDMLKAVEDVKKAECNALVVFLGNFGPETPETLIAKNFRAGKGRSATLPPGKAPERFYLHPAPWPSPWPPVPC